MDDYLAITEEGIIGELCKRDFHFFIKVFWQFCDNSEFVDNWHIGYLASELQKLGNAVIKNEVKLYDMIINLPPGTSKSMITSVLFPVWLWINNPNIKLISCSYSNATAIELSIKSRNLLQNDYFKKVFPDVIIKQDESAKGHYKLKYGGGRLTTSTGSNVIGMHADIIIGDDLENLDSVYSEAERTRVRRWVTGTLSTRKTDKLKTPTIYVQQRLHEQDLTNYLLSISNDYKHIVLPAAVSDNIKPNELKDKYVNGVLDVNRLNIAHLIESKKMLGSVNYNAQFMQDPSDAKDSIIKKEWLKVISLNDLLDINKNILNEDRYYFLDTAYGGEKADYNVIMEVVKYQNQLYILDVIRNKEEFPEFMKTLKNKLQGQRVKKVYIEGKASGKSIIQTLKKETNYNMVELIPKDSKLVRLNAVAPTVESGRVYILNMMLTEHLIEEVTTNNPANDDMRDCFVYSVNELLINDKNYGEYDVR